MFNTFSSDSTPSAANGRREGSARPSSPADMDALVAQLNATGAGSNVGSNGRETVSSGASVGTFYSSNGDLADGGMEGECYILVFCDNAVVVRLHGRGVGVPRGVLPSPLGRGRSGISHLPLLRYFGSPRVESDTRVVYNGAIIMGLRTSPLYWARASAGYFGPDLGARRRMYLTNDAWLRRTFNHGARQSYGLENARRRLEPRQVPGPWAGSVRRVDALEYDADLASRVIPLETTRLALQPTDDEYDHEDAWYLAFSDLCALLLHCFQILVERLSQMVRCQRRRMSPESRRPPSQE